MKEKGKEKEKGNVRMTKVVERRREKRTEKMRRKGKQNGKGNEGMAKVVARREEKRKEKVKRKRKEKREGTVREKVKVKKEMIAY